jgi:nucleotide-binding universal stress UspA family protein
LWSRGGARAIARNRGGGVAMRLQETTMFSNLLVPVDGSALSRRAAKHAARLAKATGASITGFHVAPGYRFQVYSEYVPRNFMLPDAYAAKAKEVAERHLGAIRKIADAAGVTFSGRYALSDDVADSIVGAAKKYSCDGS